MKELLTLLMSAIFAVSLYSAEYKVTVLGDIHYDGKSYHIAEANAPHRVAERARNIGMWESGKSREVLEAAKRMTDKNTAFVIQVGDFTQGDCDNPELQEKMFADGFDLVKGIFKDHKLLAVKGNHDVRVTSVKGFCNAPVEKVFLKRIAAELGRDSIKGNYAVKHQGDLYIFFDSFTSEKASLKFVRNTLKENPKFRYLFFVTHLPVIACSAKRPIWTIPAREEIMGILTRHNAVILTAHTHIPTFIQATSPEGTLTQLVVSSMGSNWKPQAKPAVKIKNYDEFLKSINPGWFKDKRGVKLFDELKKYQITTYEIYNIQSGFAVLKVGDKQVTAELYFNNSGKPGSVKVLQTK